MPCASLSACLKQAPTLVSSLSFVIGSESCPLLLFFVLIKKYSVRTSNKGSYLQQLIPRCLDVCLLHAGRYSRDSEWNIWYSRLEMAVSPMIIINSTADN